MRKSLIEAVRDFEEAWEELWRNEFNANAEDSWGAHSTMMYALLKNETGIDHMLALVKDLIEKPIECPRCEEKFRYAPPEKWAPGADEEDEVGPPDSEACEDMLEQLKSMGAHNENVTMTLPEAKWFVRAALRAAVRREEKGDEND